MLELFTDNLLLFLVFFIPGFISIKVYDLLVPGEPRDFSKSLFDAVAYSSLNFAVLFPLIFFMLTSDFYTTHAVWFYLFSNLILFIFPIIWPVVILKLLSFPFLAKYIRNPIPTPWDYVFGQRRPYWVIIHLKNGKKIGGKFDRKSYASSYPIEEQVYLEEVWELDENQRFIKVIDRTGGMIIFKEEVLSVELFM